MQGHFPCMPGFFMDNRMHSWTLPPVPWSRIHDWSPDFVDGGLLSMDKGTDGHCIHEIIYPRVARASGTVREKKPIR